MRKAILLFAIILLISALAGCAKKTETESAGIKESGKPAVTGEKIDLEVAIFKVAYGQDFFDRAAREYEKMHPNVTIKVWGNPKVWEQLRPRFVAGNPPDLVWPGWGLDVWGLAKEGKLVEMDKYLDEKAYGSDKKWRDTFMPALIDQGSYEGHPVIMPYVFNFYGWWYNVDMFKKHGWQPPKTYEELLTLCEKIKKAGIAPLTFQGKYPSYMMVGYIYPWVMAAGGKQAWTDAMNLKPGAWNSPAFLKAVEMMADLKKRGCFQKGAMGMDHTGSQAEFVLGRAAMVTCGTWLGTEMEKQTPPGFHMEVFYPPLPTNSKCERNTLCTQREFWIVPKDGKHPDVAIDFFKYMTSLDQAKRWVKEKKTFTAIVGSDQVDLDPYLVEPSKVMHDAKSFWNAESELWYPTLRDASSAALGGMLNGDLTPKECVDRMEAAAKKVREDDSIAKHKI